MSIADQSLEANELGNLSLLELARWGSVPTCPYCSSTRVSTYAIQKRYHCNTCNTSFSATVGTLFHNTKISLEKWYEAISYLIVDGRDLSGRELARKLGVNRNTGCRMTLSIQSAMYQKDQRLMLLMIAEKYLKTQEDDSI